MPPSALQQQLQAAEQRAQAAERRAEAAERTVALLHVQMDEQQTLLERDASRAANELSRSQLLQCRLERHRILSGSWSAWRACLQTCRRHLRWARECKRQRAGWQASP